jgi:predicted ribosomally synthesized peptide with SipW-like signal peptide
MKKILASLAIIVAVSSVAVGATKAYFTDQANLDNNTFATGILEIRLDGQEVLPGLSVTAAAPGTQGEKIFTLSNYGPPHFGGPSTLDAKGLTVSVANATGDSGLYSALWAKLYANADWGGCSNPGTNPYVAGKGCTVYNGLLSALSNEDILMATQWGLHPVLAHGNSFTMTLDIELPETHTDQGALMGKSTTFDLLFNAYSSWPIP